MDFKYTNNKVSNYEKLPNAINYLKKSDPNILIDDKLAYQAIFLWAKTHGFFTVEMRNFLETNGEDMSTILSSLLLELTNVLSELDFSDFKVDVNDQFREMTQNDRRISLIVFILYTVNLSLSQSVKFNISFTSKNGLKAILEFIKDDQTLQKLLNIKITDFSLTQLYLINYIVLDIHSMSRYYEENAQKWVEFDVLNKLLKVGKLKPDSQLDAYVAISNIATDKQIETLTEIHNVIFALSEILNNCARDFEYNKFKRSVRQIFDDEKNVQNVEIHITTRKDGIGSSILTPLRGFYQLSVNNKLRSEIYFKNNTKENLKVICYILNLKHSIFN